MQSMSDLTYYERASDIYQKLAIAVNVGVRLLPGCSFQLGQEDVRGVSLRVFKSLPSTLCDTYRPWFTEHARKEWLVYENERYTFGEVYRQYNAIGLELKG